MKNSSRLSRLQKVGLVSAGVVAGAVLAATGLAAAADNNSTTPAPTDSTSSPSQDSTAPNLTSDGHRMHGKHGNRGPETEVTGAKGEEIKAAALAEVPGATVHRIESDADGAAYEAHVIDADGNHKVITFDTDLTVVEVIDVPAMGGPHGPDGHHGPMGGGLRPDETAVTGADAEALTAAAQKELPGATVHRIETDADGAAFEVHVTTADGAHKTVKFDADKNVIGVEEGMGAGGPHGGAHDGPRDGRGHMHGHGPDDATAPGTPEA